MKAERPTTHTNKTARPHGGRLSVLLTLIVSMMMLVMSVSPAGAQDQVDPQDPQAPAVDMLWGYSELVDSPTYFRNMTDRSMRLDVDGLPHIAFGGKQLYYAWYDKITQNWQLIVVDPAFSVGEYAALALDQYDHPYISYFDAYNRALKVAYCNGNTAYCATPANWVLQMFDQPVLDEGRKETIPPNIGMASSIDIDTDNRVHISYYDPVNQVLKYIRWNGFQWPNCLANADHCQSVRVDTRYDVGFWSSIAVDSNDVPHIAYFSEQYDDMKYATIVSGAWKNYTLDDAGNVGAFTSIAIDSLDRPHISYRDRDKGVLKYIVRDTGGNWSNPVIIDNYANVGWYTSIAIKPGTNVPCISYYDYTNRNLKYACKSDGWKVITLTSILEPPDQVKHEGMFTSLAFDAYGYANISYFSEGEGYLKHAKEGPKTWSRTVVNAYAGWYAGDVGLYTSLVLDANDVPYISYFSNYDNEWDNNLKYANKLGGVWNIFNLGNLINYEGQYSSIDLDTSGEPQIAHYEMYNQRLKRTFQEGGTWYEQTVDNTLNKSLGKFASLGIDSRNYFHISYYDATDKKLMYAYSEDNGQNWFTDILSDEGDYRDVGQYTSLKVFESPAYGPLVGISYYDVTEQNMRFAYRTPILNAWEYDGEVDVKGDVGQYSSLALQPNPAAVQGYTPHIAYYDATKQDLKYAYKAPSGKWYNITVDNWRDDYRDTTDVGLYTSIEVDKYGKPHISYYDATHHDLKYATISGVQWYIVTLDYFGDVGQFTSLELTSDGRPCISYYDATNGALRYLCAQTSFHPIYLPIIKKMQ